MSTALHEPHTDLFHWDELRKGNAASFTFLFRKYYALHCARARFLVRSQDDAEDLVQEIFKKLWEQHAQLPPADNPAAYISRAVRNAALNRLRRDGRIQNEEITEKHILYDESLDAAEMERIRIQIDKAVEELPESCRKIFGMSRFENKSYKQIAEALNISPKTVENQLGIALKKLRQQLANLRVQIFFHFLLGVKWFWDVFTM